MIRAVLGKRCLETDDNYSWMIDSRVHAGDLRLGSVQSLLIDLSSPKPKTSPPTFDPALMAGQGLHCGCCGALKAPRGVGRLPLRSTPRRCASRRQHVSAMGDSSLSGTFSGRDIAAPSKGKHHFLHIDDFSKEELSAMLKTGLEVKKKIQAGEESYKPFAGLTMAMIFTKPSMRTRISFETVSMAKLICVAVQYSRSSLPAIVCSNGVALQWSTQKAWQAVLASAMQGSCHAAKGDAKQLCSHLLSQDALYECSTLRQVIFVTDPAGVLQAGRSCHLPGA